MQNRTNLVRAFAIAALGLMTTAFASAQDTHTSFPILPPSVSTIASNGDLNPYGVAFVPKNVSAGGILQPGDILVSNFNDHKNLQGRGTTIVRVDKTGRVSTFYTSSKFGLSAAVGVLSDGLVLIGNTPTVDGTPNTIQSGSLSVLNGNGQFLGTFGTIASVNGPWGMAVYDTGNGVSGTAHVFLSNVLSGSVSRFDITYAAVSVGATVTVIAQDFNHRLDPAAIALGPSGLAYDSVHDLLYVANSADNGIYTVTKPSELVEYTATGEFLGQMSIDPNNGGAFGVSTYNIGWGTFRMAAVDDNTNSLNTWTLGGPVNQPDRLRVCSSAFSSTRWKHGEECRQASSGLAGCVSIAEATAADALVQESDSIIGSWLNPLGSFAASGCSVATMENSTSSPGGIVRAGSASANGK